MIYFGVFFCVAKYTKTHKLKFSQFPKLSLKKQGIYFYSIAVHRIKIERGNFILIGNILYIKIDCNLIIISNVKDVKKCNEYLYFTALGEVKILFDCSSFYRYFIIQIESPQFNFEQLKQEAIRDLLNGGFNINFCKTAKKYIKIIENILNIHIFNKKIVVMPNKYKFEYTLIYKLNNRIKRINIKQTL